MRPFLIALAITGLMFAPRLSNAQESLPLKTQMDANVQLIVESLLAALVGRTQIVAEDTKATVLPDSQMAQGLILTEFSSTKDVARLSGNLAMQLSQQASDGILEVKLEANVSKELFFKAVVNRVSNDSADNDSAVTDSVVAQTGITDLVGLKDKLSEVVAKLEPQAQRPRQTLGARSPRNSNGAPEMSQQAVDLLKQVMAEAIVIESVDGSQTMKVDLDLIKSLVGSSTELAEVSKNIDQLVSLSMTLNSQSVTISMVSKISLPLQAVEIYDEYLSQLQANNVGKLEEVSLLISKFGPWAVGRCMHEKYQSVCVEKLLTSCVRSQSSLESCISLAQNLQSAREARNESDYLGVVTNGAGAAATSAMQSVEDTIANWMSPKEEE